MSTPASGNVLEDRELQRRIDARRFPTIDGRLTEIRATERDGRYLVRGDVTFRGVTNSYEDEMTVARSTSRPLQLEGRADVRHPRLRDGAAAVLMLKVDPEVDVRVADRRQEGGLNAMCLGIPGRLVELLDSHEHLARVDVNGVGRIINIGLLEDEELGPGDWVLIHVGFAMSKIDEDEAQRALEGLQLMGQAYDEELTAWPGRTSRWPGKAVTRDALRRRVPRSRCGASSRCSHHRAGERAVLQVHGGVRRTHPHDLSPRDRARVAGHRRARARSGLPGLRDPDGTSRRRHRSSRGAGRHLHIVRRHDAGARKRGNLLEAKARGADVRFVYSPLDALRLATEHPDREVVFFAVGFETTAPSTAITLLRARELGVTNFQVFCNHVTIVPPIRAILESPDLRLDGFLGPGHVSTVVGNRPYRFVPEVYGKPLVTTGFEPLDILQAIAMLLEQIRDGRCEVENQYTRVVRDEGNPRALADPRRGVRAASALRVARPRLHLAERAPSYGRSSPPSMPSCTTTSPTFASPIPRRASAVRC